MLTLMPRTRRAWIRCAVIGAVFLSVCVHRNVPSLWQLWTYHPQDGDIVFQSLPRGELVDAIEGATHSPWSHCGVVVNERHLWWVVESIGQVRKTPLLLWIIRGRRGSFAAYRSRQVLAARQRLHRSLDHYLGRPYDFHYAPSDTEIYCSELVYNAYRDAFGLKLGEWERLGDLDWEPQQKVIRSIESGEVPFDRKMITPVGLTRSNLLKRVYPKDA